MLQNCYHPGMSSRLIIDGYNLMHAMGLVRGKLVGKQLEGARTRLLRQLAWQLTKEERAHAVVVFDAKSMLPVTSREECLEGFRVLYPEPGHEADELIEHLISVDLQPRKLRVVSSDRRLHRAARERMAAATNCDQFLDELDERKKAPADPPSVETPRPASSLPNFKASGNAPRPAPVDVNYWMQEFGDIEIPTDIGLPDDLAGSVPESESTAKVHDTSPKQTSPGKSPVPPATGLGQPLHVPAVPVSPAIATPLKKTPERLRRELDPDGLSVPSASDEVRKDPELEFWERELRQVLDEERRR